MPVRSGKTDGHATGVRPTKKPVPNKSNDLTERTQRTVLERFTDEQMAEFRELFNMFDKDNQGDRHRQTNRKCSLTFRLKGC